MNNFRQRTTKKYIGALCYSAYGGSRGTVNLRGRYCRPGGWRYGGGMISTSSTPSYAGYRLPAEVISYALWLSFRFPLSLRMVEEMLAVRGIEVSHETVRKWGLPTPAAGRRQLDEM